MEKLFNIEVTSPQASIYQGYAFSLIAPGELGYLGVLANHAPLITNLVPGKISIKEASGSWKVINSKAGGFLEVVNNKATLLLDSSEAAS